MLNKVKLWGQLKHLAGEEYLEVADASTVNDLIFKLAKQKSEISEMLIVDNKPNPSILVFINDNQHLWETERSLTETDSITLMSPIAGG
ncbi:MoaD/ThiS family protein [Lentisphaera profundi]|uniref:MoaD/ThiS family protein n=1 Tax=Lentisphaera profundi TaxID=1658616 RepID=A0ABY7VPB9_9BACT|nr:MoaD/ThiS family protein [Lentisphaera profundi]WDE95542.1 MoaD/ThiS family protein [Lentisphaera profundi]